MEGSGGVKALVLELVERETLVLVAPRCSGDSFGDGGLVSRELTDLQALQANREQGADLGLWVCGVPVVGGPIRIRPINDPFWPLFPINNLPPTPLRPCRRQTEPC